MSDPGSALLLVNHLPNILAHKLTLGEKQQVCVLETLECDQRGRSMQCSNHSFKQECYSKNVVLFVMSVTQLSHIKNYIHIWHIWMKYITFHSPSWCHAHSEAPILGTVSWKSPPDCTDACWKPDWDNVLLLGRPTCQNTMNISLLTK